MLIIDSDDSTRLATKAVFDGLGVTDIQDFADGEAAWAAIDAGKEPSLIIMEWRIPQLTGPLLMQRIRSKGFLNVPVIIQSSLIKPSDMSIIREMGIANLVQKPAERETLLKTIIWTIQQERMPTEQQSIENKIRTYLSVKNITEAEPLVARYLAEPNIADGRKNIIRAELAYAKDQFEAARDFAIESLKGATESIFALNILGKSLMTLRQYEAALKCFQKAQSMSPVNLERLILTAETQAEIGQAEAATETVAKAKDIDPDSTTVTEGEVRVAVASGSPESAKKMIGQMQDIGKLISYLNNKAVAHSKCGFQEEGIELYRNTLESVPDDQVEIKAVVTYNMALAKIRKNDLADALVDLAELIAIPGTKVGKKAASLHARLQSSVASNTDFTLREADAPASSVVVTQEGEKIADGATMASFAVEIESGDMCCYLVFKSTAEESSDQKKILTTPPKYKPRNSISRGAAFASDVSNKAS